MARRRMAHRIGIDRVVMLLAYENPSAKSSPL
jgi:hypothetical protein